MPSSISANMLTEMRGQNRVHPVFELTLGSTTLRFAEEAVASTSQGLYKPFVTSWSGFSREANTSAFSLIIPSPNVSVFDAERVLQKALGGPQKAAVRGSAAKCYWRSNAVASGDHYKFFDGVVTNYQLSGDRLWSFALSPNIDPMYGQPKIPFLTEVDFPDAPEEFLGQPLWIVYGKHHSAGVPETSGMIKAVPAVVDSSGDSIDWILSYGQGTIQRLFRPISGTVTEDTSNWGFYTLQRGKHRYQMARYTGGGAKPKPDDAVTVDMQGLFSTAPTTASAPFENPAECIRNFLAHFVFGDGDVRAGTTWATETGKPIATAIFDTAETYFSDRNHVMAKVIYANDKPLDIFNEWCESFDAVPMWSDTWGIGAIPENEAETGIYQNERHISQRRRQAISELAMDTTRSQPVTEVSIGYLLAESSGTLTKKAIITDPTATDPVREQFDFKYGAASVI